MPPENLTLDQIAQAVVARLEPEATHPAPGTQSMVRFGQAGAYEVIASPNWWDGFAQAEPTVEQIIDITTGGIQVVPKVDALERLNSFSFGQGALLGVVEAPLNDAFKGVPGGIGSIVVGGGLGIVTSEVIDAFVSRTNANGESNFVNPVVKAVVGIAAPLLIGKQLMSRTGNMFFAASLLLDAVTSFSQIDSWLRSLSNWVIRTFRSGTGQANRFDYLAGNDTGYQLESGWAGGGGSVRTAQFLPGRGGVGDDALSGIFNRRF